MPEAEKVGIVVREWVLKAENDLNNAVHTLDMGKGCPADTVCFHAQQCVEKYLKAALVSKGIAFPKTHVIAKLVALSPKDFGPILRDVDQERLTDYAGPMRYPGDYEPVTLAEARRAVRIARRVRTQVRKLVPKEALRRRKPSST